MKVCRACKISFHEPWCPFDHCITKEVEDECGMVRPEDVISDGHIITGSKDGERADDINRTPGQEPGGNNAKGQ